MAQDLILNDESINFRDDDRSCFPIPVDQNQYYRQAFFFKSRPHQGRRRNMFSDPSRSTSPSWKEARRYQGHQEGRGESREDS